MRTRTDVYYCEFQHNTFEILQALKRELPLLEKKNSLLS